jgi:flagellar biosynthetic protein FlhB
VALFRDDAGRTERPTPQRLAQARDKGQVALSHDLIMGGALLANVLLLERLGPSLVRGLQEILARGLRVDEARARLDDGDLPAAIGAMLEPFALIALPFAALLLSALLTAAVLGYAQVGVHVAKEAVGFKPERLNPLTGLRRILSWAAITRAALSAGKLVVFLAVPAILLWVELPTLLSLLHAGDVPAMVAYAAGLALRAMFWIAIPVCGLACIDVLWQRREHVQHLMMTKQEVDDERKRSEGDPLIKRRLRTAALKLARQRMLEAVPKADVVVTNPTHFAVALAYDRALHPAPRVVAKGVDELAAKIRQLAREHGVPLMSDPPLARALYRAVDVGTEIPERFYQAVAAILGHVYRLQGKAV